MKKLMAGAFIAALGMVAVASPKCGESASGLVNTRMPSWEVSGATEIDNTAPGMILIIR